MIDHVSVETERSRHSVMTPADSVPNRIDTEQHLAAITSGQMRADNLAAAVRSRAQRQGSAVFPHDIPMEHLALNGKGSNGMSSMGNGASMQAAYSGGRLPGLPSRGSGPSGARLASFPATLERFNMMPAPAPAHPSQLALHASAGGGGGGGGPPGLGMGRSSSLGGSGAANSAMMGMSSGMGSQMAPTGMGLGASAMNSGMGPGMPPGLGYMLPPMGGMGLGANVGMQSGMASGMGVGGSHGMAQMGQTMMPSSSGMGNMVGTTSGMTQMEQAIFAMQRQAAYDSAAGSGGASVLYQQGQALPQYGSGAYVGGSTTGMLVSGGGQAAAPGLQSVEGAHHGGRADSLKGALCD
jgi:hypothetical protein